MKRSKQKNSTTCTVFFLSSTRCIVDCFFKKVLFLTAVSCYSSTLAMSGRDNEDFDPLLDEAEALELGQCKELLNEEYYMPCHKSRDWVRCFITTTPSGGYRFYLEGSKQRFLLSAKLFGHDCILISAYEDFPVIDIKPKKGFVAKLEKQSDSTFVLGTNYCHLCDNRLGYFTCGRGCEEREVLAKIVHSIKRYSVVNVDFRMITLTIPSVTDAGRRKIWCPRSFRTVNPHIPNSADFNECLYQTPHMGVRFVNKLPEWDKTVGSLVLKFQGNRILTSSSKNFLLFDEKHSKYDLAEQSTRTSTTDSTSQKDSVISDFTGSDLESEGNLSHNSGVGVGAAAALNIPKVSKHRVSGSSSSGGASRGGQGGSRRCDIGLDAEQGRSSKHNHRSSSSSSGSGSGSGAISNNYRSKSGIPVPSLGSKLSRIVDDEQDFMNSERSTVDDTDNTPRYIPTPRDMTPRSPVADIPLTPRTERTEGKIPVQQMPLRKTAAGPLSSGGSYKSSPERRKNNQDDESLTPGTSVSEELTEEMKEERRRLKREKAEERARRKERKARKQKKGVEAADLAILQFGKSTSTRFVLDFRYPLSPIQAFGIALSSLWYQESAKSSGGGAYSTRMPNGASANNYGSSRSNPNSLGRQFLEPRRIPGVDATSSGPVTTGGSASTSTSNTNATQPVGRGVMRTGYK